MVVCCRKSLLCETELYVVSGTTGPSQGLLKSCKVPCGFIMRSGRQIAVFNWGMTFESLGSLLDSVNALVNVSFYKPRKARYPPKHWWALDVSNKLTLRLTYIVQRYTLVPNTEQVYTFD